MHATLRSTPNQAVAWEMLERNPEVGIELRLRKSRKPPVILTMSQIRAMLETLPEPTKSIVTLIVFAFMRPGEVLALLWKRIGLPDVLSHRLGQRHCQGQNAPGRCEEQRLVAEVWRPKLKAQHHRIILCGTCSTNHRYGQNIGHDSSIRTPRTCWFDQLLICWQTEHVSTVDKSPKRVPRFRRCWKRASGGSTPHGSTGQLSRMAELIVFSNNQC